MISPQAIRILRAGGIIAYPTEAVYGIGCDPASASALERVLKLKRRALARGLIVIGAAPEMLTPFVRADWVAWVHEHLAPEPEVPTTWLVPARAGAPTALTGQRFGGRGARVAVRVTSHPVASELCRAFGGALVSTSANVATTPPARTALDARLRLGSELDLVVPGPTGGHARPSTIRDAASGSVLRA